MSREQIYEIGKIVGGGVPSIPYIEKCFADYPHCANPGIDVMALLRMLHNAGIRVNMVKYSNFGDMKKALIEGSIDIMLRSISQNVSSLQECCLMTSPVLVERPAFFVRKENSTRLRHDGTLFDTYDWAVWFWLICCILGTAGFAYASERIMRRRLRRDYRMWAETSTWATGKLLEHFLAFVFSLLLNVVGNTFAIMLAGQPKHILPFNSYPELLTALANDKCFMITYEDSFADFRDSLPELFKFPETYVSLPPDTTRYTALQLFFAQQKQKACTVILDFASLTNLYLGRAPMLTSITYDTLPEYTKVFWYNKALPTFMRNRLTLAVISGTTTDMYNRLIQKDTIYRGYTSVLEHSSVKIERLKLGTIMETIYLLVGGVGVGVIYIIAEIAYWATRRVRKTGWNLKAFLLYKESSDKKSVTHLLTILHTSSMESSKRYSKRNSKPLITKLGSELEPKVEPRQGLYRRALVSGELHSKLINESQPFRQYSATNDCKVNLPCESQLI